jgi:hypothetical protein
MEAVRRNVQHGLPLTIDDRRRAVVRVLAKHAAWSDRRIGSLCGLSDKTVARLRRTRSAGDFQGDGALPGSVSRVGRDGKTRRVQTGEVRDRVLRALRENPNGSLRAIAAIAGASPETVRTVRATFACETSDPCNVASLLPICDDRHPGAGFHVSATEEVTLQEDGHKGAAWVPDVALLTCGDSGDFARWFSANNVDDGWHRYVLTVPLGRIYEVVDEARRRAASWASFASMLESRTRCTRPVSDPVSDWVDMPLKRGLEGQA